MHRVDDRLIGATSPPRDLMSADLLLEAIDALPLGHRAIERAVRAPLPAAQRLCSTPQRWQLRRLVAGPAFPVVGKSNECAVADNAPCISTVCGGQNKIYWENERRKEVKTPCNYAYRITSRTLSLLLLLLRLW